MSNINPLAAKAELIRRGLFGQLEDQRRVARATDAELIEAMESAEPIDKDSSTDTSGKTLPQGEPR